MGSGVSVNSMEVRNSVYRWMRNVVAGSEGQERTCAEVSKPWLQRGQDDDTVG